ncbi:MAG: periplasmic heavy metal sensor [Verrucomicrobiota bacterium]
MKRNFLIVAAVGALALSGFALAQEETGPRGGGRRHGHGFAMEHLTHGLNLTPDQQAKVKPIFDQARPQIIAIHQEAMQKTKAVMDGAMTQIRPLLNAEQQKKFDEMQKARQEMHSARQKLHDAMKE